MSIQVTSVTAPVAAEKAAVEEGQTKTEPVEKSAEQKETVESEPAETEAKEEEKEGASDDAEDESESDDSDEEIEASDSEKDKPKKKSGSLRRKERAERAEAEVARLQRLVEEMAFKNAGESPKTEQKPEPKQVSLDGKPNPDHFDTYVEYTEALTDWKIEQKEKARAAEQEKSRLVTEQQQLMAAHQSRMDAFAESNEGFTDAIQDLLKTGIRFSPTVDDILISSEMGPALILELAKNPAELKRINALPPTRAALEMGKIEAKLSSQTSAEKKPEPKPITTKAPQPITPVGSKGGKVEKSISDPNLSQREYEALRAKQMRQARA
jgi:hypothetical protein